jgi:SET domain-containing protein
MYLIKVEVKDSLIEGKGVFALEPIKHGTIAWKFDASHDQTMTPVEFNNLDKIAQAELQRVAYLSLQTSRWVYPPEGDPARFTNHNPESNNLSVGFDKSISDEPYFIANRDIKAGEELTNNYLEFDARPEEDTASWV